MPKAGGKRAKAKTETGYYVLEVSDWRWESHLGINASRLSDDPLSEIQTLELSGPLLGPQGAKCRSGLFRLSGDNRTTWSARKTSPAPALSKEVGHLRKAGEVLEGNLRLPPGALATAVSLLTAARLKMVVACGPRLFRGEAGIRWFTADTKLAPEDYPDDYG